MVSNITTRSYSLESDRLFLNLCVCLCVYPRSDVAILYNDRSVLENHHISAAYKLMAEDDMNILVNLNKDDWRYMYTTRTYRSYWLQMNWLIHVFFFFFQRAEVAGYRDGDGNRHVLSLPADQNHKERSEPDTRVSATATNQGP